MATQRYDEVRHETCGNCGAKNLVKSASAPGPATEWYSVKCAKCGHRLGPDERTGLLIIELED